MSDEHVIPKAIGGCYHVFNVCGDCNSKRFGAYVDPLLTDHPLIQLIRWQKQLKGHNGNYPHPFSKPDASSDGSKYGVSDKAGVLEPYLYPQIKIERDNMGQLTQLELQIDISEADKSDDIINKRLEREGIDLAKIKYKRTITKAATTPTLHYHWEMDLRDFNLDLLKMAYEFTCDSIKDYENDETARHIADILYHHDPKRLDELNMSNHKLDKIIDFIFGDYIDFSSDDRHYLLLLCKDNKMICIVRLFNNICTGFVMSENMDIGFFKSRILINDTAKHVCEYLSMEELITRISGAAEVSFVFDRKRYKGGLNLKHIPRNQEYFGHDWKGEVVLFDEYGVPIANTAQYAEKLHEQRKAGGVAAGYIITYYFPTERVYVLFSDKNELIPIKSFSSRSKLTKY